MIKEFSSADQAHSSPEYVHHVPIIRQQMSPEYREYIRRKARKNAASLGLSAQEWAAMRKGREGVADLLMALDPEGERMRLDREKNG